MSSAAWHARIECGGRVAGAAVLELDHEVIITPATLTPADAAFGEPPRKPPVGLRGAGREAAVRDLMQPVVAARTL